MTVKELKQMLRELPNDMQVVLPFGDYDLITACKINSEIITVVNEEESCCEKVFILNYCSCDYETNEIDINLNMN